MYKFLESICFSSGNYHLLNYHQERVNLTFSRFFPQKRPFLLTDILPNLSGMDKQKVRIEYDMDGFEIGVSNYKSRNIQSLTLIEADKIDYAFKYANRTTIDQLLSLRNGAEDILIIKYQKVTDCSYANVLFKDEKGWVTPKSYLLNGVKRRKLLQENVIREQEISVKDISQFSMISLINAMLDPGDISLPVSQIMR
ncbi:MAG: aminotransferase class IV [Bacteroidota bacterium]